VKQSKSFDIERKIKIVYLDEDLRIARYAAAAAAAAAAGLASGAAEYALCRTACMAAEHSSAPH
jgi:hypothetical protein